MAGYPSNAKTISEALKEHLISFKHFEKMLEDIDLKDLEDDEDWQCRKKLDIKAIRARIYEKLKASGESASDEDNIKYIREAICLGLTRGNNVERIKHKMSADGRQKVERLQLIFGLEKNTSQNSDALTLSRIMLCFPETTADIASSIKPDGPVLDIPDEYPHAMRNGSFSALIPRRVTSAIPKSELSIIKKSHLLYLSKMSNILSGKSENALNFELLLGQREYMNRDIRDSLYSDDDKSEIIKSNKHGLYTDGQLNASVIEHAIEYDGLGGPIL